MSGTQSRIEPSRSWFSNTKVITQNALQKFQDDMKTAMADPYQVESIPDLNFSLHIQIELQLWSLIENEQYSFSLCPILRFLNNPALF